MNLENHAEKFIEKQMLEYDYSGIVAYLTLLVMNNFTHYLQKEFQITRPEQVTATHVERYLLEYFSCLPGSLPDLVREFHRYLDEQSDSGSI